MYYKICETISSEQNLFVIVYIAGLNYCQHLQTRSSLALSQGRWWHTMVVTDCSVLVTGGLYSDTVHPTKCLTVSTSPPPLVNICTYLLLLFHYSTYICTYLLFLLLDTKVMMNFF